MGLGHREKSQLSKECIGPAAMVGQSAPGPGTLLLLAPQRAQPSPDKAVHAAEGPRMRVLKVAVPALEHRIQFRDNAGETVPASAPGLGPDTIAYRVQTLAPHPALSRLKVIAQKVEHLAFLPTIPDMVLVWIQAQRIRLHPSLHFGESRPRLFGAWAQHHEVVRVAHHPITPFPPTAIQ